MELQHQVHDVEGSVTLLYKDVDARYRVWGGVHPGVWMCDPGSRYGKKCHPGDCGYVKPCIGSGGWDHTGNSGCENPGTGSGRGVTLETGRVTPVHGPRGCVTLETMDMRPQVQGLEGMSPWKLWIYDPRYRVGGWSPWRQ